VLLRVGKFFVRHTTDMETLEMLFRLGPGLTQTYSEHCKVQLRFVANVVFCRVQADPAGFA